MKSIVFARDVRIIFMLLDPWLSGTQGGFDLHCIYTIGTATSMSISFLHILSFLL